MITEKEKESIQNKLDFLNGKSFEECNITSEVLKELTNVKNIGKYKESLSDELSGKSEAIETENIEARKERSERQERKLDIEEKRENRLQWKLEIEKEKEEKKEEKDYTPYKNIITSKVSNSEVKILKIYRKLSRPFVAIQVFFAVIGKAIKTCHSEKLNVRNIEG